MVNGDNETPVNVDDNEASVNEKPSVLSLIKSEGIILAAASVFAYVFAFVYQAGYCNAFMVPREFISTSLTDVLNIGGSVLGIFALLLGFINLITSFLPRKIYHHPSLVRRLSGLLYVFMLSIPLLLFPEGRLLAIGLLLLCLAIMFLPALLTRRLKGTYLQRMEAIDNGISGDDPWEQSGSIHVAFVNLVGRKAYVFIVYILLSILVTYNAGKASGFYREVFPIVNTAPETVVLFMTSERLITAPFDRKKRTIQPVFRVINFDDQTDLTLQLWRVGPLKLVPMKPMASPDPLPTSTP
jgi:hypothetical protein